MKTIVKTMLALTVATVSLASHASTDPSATEIKPELKKESALNVEGKLQCFYNKSRRDVLFIEVVKNDGDSISISDPSDEMKAKCGPHGKLTDLSFKVEGELTSRFLFWGGNLKVNSFQVSQN